MSNMETTQTPAPGDMPTPPSPVPAVQTRRVTVTVPPAGEISFLVADDPNGEVYFSLGVRKSGSTMLHRIVNVLARRAGLNTVDIPDAFFRRGLTVGDWSKVDLSELIRPGNVYVGYRTFPSNLGDNLLFQKAWKVFLFRDPRDALVSQYFSDAYSHALPSSDTETGRKAAEAFERKREQTRAMGIDEYVIKNAKQMEKTLLGFGALLKDPTCLCLRYEDYVFQKKRMIYKILHHFEWSCPAGVIEGLLQHVDFVPDSEDKTRFVRRVIPGDHRNRLRPETVKQIK
jgi:hypothetical protein